jgi:glycosyltransferase involved in cell wall biosynthesis
MVIERYHPIWGGSENQLRALCASLLQQGLSLCVVTRRWEEAWPEHEVVDGIPVYRVGIGGTGTWSTTCYVLATLAFLLRRGGPEVVFHSHGAVALGALTRVAAWLRKAATVAKIATAGKVPGRQASLASRSIFAIFAQTDAIVAISDEIAEELARWRVRENSIRRIPNGVDTQRFRPYGAGDRRGWRLNQGIGPDDPVIVFSGRLVQRKGVAVLFDAWPAVLQQHPDAFLAILGTGDFQPDSVEPELRRRVEHGGLSRVALMGSVERPEDCLCIADVFVFPSLLEGFPNALLEGMAAGAACVATDIGGNREIVCSSDYGVLVPPADSEALGKAICGLLSDRVRIESLQRNGRAFVEKTFSLKFVSSEYVRLYRELPQSAERSLERET